jgi:hypothetical protein
MKITAKLKRFLLLIVIIFGFLYLFLFSGITQVGSYPYAQEYQFDVPVKELYNRVEKFKADNPEYDPSKEMNLHDSFVENGFSDMYIIYKEKNTLVHIVISGKIKSLYFDALNNLSDEFKWNCINRDFNRKENMAAKREIRSRFLDKLNLNYKDNGNNAFVFWK